MKEWLEFFKKFRISGFKSCCNIAKQIATGLEIEIKLEIITFSRKEYYFYDVSDELIINEDIFSYN